MSGWDAQDPCRPTCLRRILAAISDRVARLNAALEALGCVLYEMIAGQPPFSATTAQAVLVRTRGATTGAADAGLPAIPVEVVVNWFEELKERVGN